MPLQNRVTPLGEVIADEGCGLVYGNRSCLHDEPGGIKRRYNGRRWIACRLRFRDWHREPLMQPRPFTELFFLDEATAFAAGPRPCALCRRVDYNRFVVTWRELHRGSDGADAIGAQLHAERIDSATRGQLRHSAPLAVLPDGAYVLRGGGPFVVCGRHLLAWSPTGYTRRLRRPDHEVAEVITPPSVVAVLRSGWEGAVPFLHPSAHG